MTTPPFWMEGGSMEFPLGTDNLGRCILCRIMYGARVSLLIGVCSVIVAGIIGTLFGLVAFNGIMGVAVPSREASEHLRDASLTVLYPAVFLLTFGTFLGAVWANISWGSYWAWDPKETWALITLLVYSFTLHGGALKPFRNARFFHGYTIAAFLCVLITYFGVNLILGGMHSYA
jgi:ABC-type transport system involved in cytochrome c biogenesis permease subunit